MIPLLTYPFALLGAVSIPVLVTIYLMHSRFRRRTVSSLFLWQAVQRSREGGAHVHKGRFPPVFFLEMLIFVLLVLAAVDPRWLRRASHLPLTIVLDNSISLQATDVSGLARERGITALDAEMAALRPTAVRLIRAGIRADILGPSRPAEAIGHFLRKWDCSSPAGNLVLGTQLALETGDSGGRILIVTDHPPECPPADGRIRWVAIGIPSPNVGFVNAARSVGETTDDRCLFEIRNASAGSARTSLAVSALPGGLLLFRTELSLEPGETRRIVIGVPADAGALTATISPDSLEADNQVWLPPVRRQRVRVAYAVTDPDLAGILTPAVNATGLVDPSPGEPHLLLRSGVPSSAEEVPAWQVCFVKPGTPRAFVGPFVIDRNHPFTDGLDLRSIIWAAGEVESGPGLPVIMAGDFPLLTDNLDIERGSGSLLIYFDPALSNLQHTPNWPILFWNLLAWRAAELPGFRQTAVHLGEPLVYRLEEGRVQGRVPVEFRGPQGKVSPVENGREATLTGVLPGIYEARLANRTDYAAVNLCSVAESDLSGCRSGSWGKWHDQASIREEYASSRSLMGLLALAGIVLHTLIMYGGRRR